MGKNVLVEALSTTIQDQLRKNAPAILSKHIGEEFRQLAKTASCPMAQQLHSIKSIVSEPLSSNSAATLIFLLASGVVAFAIVSALCFRSGVLTAVEEPLLAA